MEQCLYEPVNSKEVVILKTEDNKNNGSWKPLLRQVFVCSGIWNSFFMAGLCHGAPTVIVPQLRREANSTEAVGDDMASWLYSVHGYAALPWLILPILSAKIGRKYPYFIVSIITLVSFIGLYCSNTAKQILITEIMIGPLLACQITISIVIITEYSSPTNRGLFLTLKSASMNWGMWTANAFGTFFHWRTIAIAGIICALYNVLSTLFWCESPSWLASKYRYEECAKEYRWVKGNDEKSEKELEALIKSCKELKNEGAEKKLQSNFWIRTYKTMSEISFYKPLMLCIGILSLYHTSGKVICSVYAIDIIKQITSSESTAYMGMLLLDGVTVTGMYIGCGLAKCSNRRTLLLTGASGGIFFLFILALYLFLCKLQVIDENKYMSLGLLTLFFLFISFGPIIMSTSIYGELLSLKHKTAGMFITGSWTMFLLSTSLKTAPKIFRSFGLHGAFLFYGSLSSAIIFYLYKYLPETKDKTMEEIEVFFSRNPKKDFHIESQPMYHVSK